MGIIVVDVVIHYRYYYRNRCQRHLRPHRLRRHYHHRYLESPPAFTRALAAGRLAVTRLKLSNTCPRSPALAEPRLCTLLESCPRLKSTKLKQTRESVATWRVESNRNDLAGRPRACKAESLRGTLKRIQFYRGSTGVSKRLNIAAKSDGPLPENCTCCLP